MNEEAAAVTPTSIITGFGYNVCLILNHFVECALQAINFQVKPMIYSDNGADDIEIGGSGDPEEDEEVSEIVYFLCRLDSLFLFVYRLDVLKKKTIIVLMMELVMLIL
jgi:hypothetical protein